MNSYYFLFAFRIIVIISGLIWIFSNYKIALIVFLILLCFLLAAFLIVKAKNYKNDKALSTKRIYLRPWRLSDAEELFRHASNEDVGPKAGWPAHRTLEESRRIIKNELSLLENYAIVLKETDKPIGSIGLIFEGHSEIPMGKDEVELGFWLGKDYWGQGLMTEAVKLMVNHIFNDLGYSKIWCGYYDDNIQSKRVQEKCGFKYDHTEENHYCPLIDEHRTMHLNCLEK